MNMPNWEAVERTIQPLDRIEVTFGVRERTGRTQPVELILGDLVVGLTRETIVLPHIESDVWGNDIGGIVGMSVGDTAHIGKDSSLAVTYANQHNQSVFRMGIGLRRPLVMVKRLKDEESIVIANLSAEEVLKYRI